MAKDLSEADLKRVVEGIEQLGSYELVTLKAHVLTEIALGRLLAARLHVPVESIPRLKFSHLARLALAGIDDIAGFAELVRALDNLRNSYAHEAIPRGDDALIRRIVEGVGSWPNEPAAQTNAFKRAVEVIFVAILNYAFTSSMTSEEWADFERGLKEKAASTVDALSGGTK